MSSQNLSRRATATTLSLLLAACGAEKKPAPPAAPPQVSVLTVHRSNVPTSIELPGRTTAHLMAQVRARVDGIVLQRAFKEGADVKAGQLLYQLDPAPYRAALLSAQAVLQKNQASQASAAAQLARYQVLVAANAVSKQAYDNAVAAQGQAAADVAAAKAALANAKINLGYTSVVAPIGGLSAISQVTQGAYVQGSAATLLTTIQQIDPIYVDLQQSSAEGLQLRRRLAEGRIKADGAGVKVELTLEDGSAYGQRGSLEFNGVTVDPTTGSVTLRALFPNPQHVLLPGMFVRAKVGQGVQQDAMLVPVHSVARNRQGEAVVLVVGADNQVRERSIVTGNMIGSDWVVDSGLNDGERVLVEGSQKTKPGSVVTASEVTKPANQRASGAAANAGRTAPASQ